MALGLALAACGRAPEAAAPVPVLPRVRTTAVRWSEAAIPVTAQGVLAKRTESVLSFKIGGIIRTVKVRAGDRVHAGDELAALDLAEIDAEVARATAMVEKARRDLARAEKLYEQNVVAVEQAQDARTGVEMAEAAWRTADFNRRFATINAPADGVILRREVEPNELITSGKAVLHFAADAEPWIVRAGLSERELVGVHTGSAAQIVFAGRPPIAAVVTHVAGITDAMTRTVPLEIELQNPPPDLRSGFVAHVVVTPDPVPRRPEIPLEALVAGDGRTAQVFLLNSMGPQEKATGSAPFAESPARRDPLSEGSATSARRVHTVRRVSIEIEALYDGVAYLVSPLPEGAALVTTGAEFLADGAAVEVVE